MFINYKFFCLNYFLIILLLFTVILFQNSIWLALFGISAPLHLWIPFLVYWILYREKWEAVLMVYFISFAVIANSSMDIGYLIVFNSLLFIVTLFFKKVYYTGVNFFSSACLTALLAFPILLWVLSVFIQDMVYLPSFLSWLAGVLISWVLSFPLLFCIKAIDKLTMQSSSVLNPKGDRI